MIEVEARTMTYISPTLVRSNSTTVMAKACITDNPMLRPVAARVLKMRRITGATLARIISPKSISVAEVESK